MIGPARALCPPQEDVLELTRRALPRPFARGEPRLFLPTKGWRVRLGASKMYPAVRRGARAYRAALRAWLASGGARLTHRVNPQRGGEWPLGDLLLPDMPTLSSAAVSIGIPGPARKITVQLMDDRGRTLGFAKYAESPYARRLLANEARMLELIPPGVGPRLLRFTPFLAGDLLVQTPLAGRVCPPRLRLDGPQKAFFGRLEKPGKAYGAAEHPFIEGLHTAAGKRAGTLKSLVDALGSVEWPVAYAHGDMAPWNMHRWRGSCLAFDWEHGTDVGFPHLDAAAMLIQVATIIRQDAPSRAKRTVSHALAAYLGPKLGGFAPELAALSAVSMLASWYPPREYDANARWLEAFIATPA